MAPQAAIIKKHTIFYIKNPVQTSKRIFLTSILSVPWRDTMVVLPSRICSSTSCDVCQKKRYGEIVVPKMAQMRMICSLLHSLEGIKALENTSCQSSLAKMAEAT